MTHLDGTPVANVIPAAEEKVSAVLMAEKAPELSDPEDTTQNFVGESAHPTETQTSPQVVKYESAKESQSEVIKPEESEDDESVLVPGYADMQEVIKKKAGKSPQEQFIDNIKNSPVVNFSRECLTEVDEIVKKALTPRINVDIKEFEERKLAVTNLNQLIKREREVSRKKKMTMPMLNSGFLAEIESIGAIDFMNLYSVDPDDADGEYEKALIKTLMSTVRGTTPDIPPKQFGELLHYTDLDLLTLCVISGTHRKVNWLHVCEECNSHITLESSPLDLIMDYNVINDTTLEFSRRTVYGDVVNNSRCMETIIDTMKNEGILIYYKEPSIVSYTDFSKQLAAYVTSMKNQKDKENAGKIGLLLAYIPRIVDYVLGVDLVALDAKYHYIKNMDPENLEILRKEITKRTEEQKILKIGFSNIECPKCGHVHKEILIPNAQQLAFFHLLVSNIKQAEITTQEK